MNLMDHPSWPLSYVFPHARIISDNDYSGDPDGLAQLAQHLLSPSVSISGVIGTRLNMLSGGADFDYTPLVASAVALAQETAALCGRSEVPVYAGAVHGLLDHHTPIESPGAQFIVAEAMRDDTDLPLFVCCGAGLTEIASAYLMEPRIAERLTLVWIGGHEYNDADPIGPGAGDLEYNLSIDLIAGQVIFNQSRMPIWQVPRNVYRQCLTSRSELIVRLGDNGALGDYLLQKIGLISERFAGMGIPLGEAYVLGDSPLALLTVLPTMMESDVSSSEWVDRPCPRILNSGLYELNPDGQPIRTFERIDNRTMLEDFFAKVTLRARSQS
jgi:purine nucleosidase